ncbi:GNAT family N-acetyltransferase [Bacillus salacetis]|uniref:GNAT family N-acetyltransferase n=1 Tax=Bacillus salacetis TaxID=2315464 RepID=A0A3A1R597_9BACI|nr:GNAT family N-acetyltransferase [Bacillus salacetis]RIW38329.1 GNAT family N-acetyltransferase [Bacillus salacetis]
MVRLKRMTAKEFDAFLDHSIENYAKEKTEAGNWAPEEALENSKNDFKRLLPNRENSEDNYLYTIWDNDLAAGSIWLAKIGEDTGYIYNIFIEPEHQGKGYGKQAMLEIEKAAKALGFSKIELHVFGHNQTARNLYEKLEYEVTNVIMAKKLS